MHEDKASSRKATRTEIISLHCTQEERELIERAAEIRAGGNVDAYLLNLVKFVESVAAKA